MGLFFVEQVSNDTFLARTCGCGESHLQEGFRLGLAAGLIAERIAAAGGAECSSCGAYFDDPIAATARLRVRDLTRPRELTCISACLRRADKVNERTG